MSTTQFPSSNANSNRHQRTVVLWLKSKGFAVKDVSADPVFQTQDIDLIVMRGAARRTVEFKADNVIGKTGNLVFEIVSNLERATLGCLMYSKADWLYYYDVQSGHLHMIRLKPLRLLFSSRKLKSGSWASAQTAVGQTAYTTINLLIPLRRIKDDMPANDYRWYDLSSFAGEGES